MSESWSELTANERFEALPDELTGSPWKSIYQYYEQVFPKAGGKVFRYAGLQAVSAFAPKFEIDGQEKRIAINLMLLGNSGSGKTSLMKAVENVTPRSYYVSSDSEANMEDKLARKGRDGVTLVINDMKRILGDSGRIKAIEAMIGDGRISRKNKRDSIEGDNLDISMIGGAVPSDVTSQIGGGLIFRVVPVMVRYGKKRDSSGRVVEDEASEVGRKIVMGAGEENPMDFDENDITRYYRTLYQISNGEFSGHKKPVGYDLGKSEKNIIFNMWDNLRKERNWDNEDVNWNRELIDGLRFACLMAFVNLPNRRKVNLEDRPNECVIDVTERDAKRAAQLMKAEMALKWKYIQLYLLDDMQELSDVKLPKSIADSVSGN